MIQSTPDPLIIVVVSLIFGLVIPLGFYIWYGFALSRLFPKLGEQGWKGWVPILNEVVILERGGVPGWSVILYVLPIVSLYGLYLKALAMVRLGQRFGQGAGLVVLGFVLPPLWATLLARKAASVPSENYGERIQGMMMPDNRGASPAGMPTGPLAAPPAPPASPALSTPSAPLAPPAPPAPPMPPAAPPAAPVTVPPVPAGPMSAAQHVGVEPVVPMPSMPEPSAAVEPVAGGSPWAPHSPAVAVPGRPETPVVGSPPSFDANANVAELPTIIPAQHSGILNVDDDDELDRTVVVDRRPVVRWSLVTESGVTLPLTSNSVLLGRKPASTDVSVELVAVPDETRTLSKNHARLDLRDEVWTITDLKSTNGVILVAPDGQETELPPGGSAELSAQFILGNVSLSLTFENGVS